MLALLLPLFPSWFALGSSMLIKVFNDAMQTVHQPLGHLQIEARADAGAEQLDVPAPGHSASI